MIESRDQGQGAPVVVLHGGPGAPGGMDALCAALARDFRVLAPVQRGSGGAPLTVARHIDDLHALCRARGLVRPALVGHSWGAMLALAYAAAHPEAVGPIVLVASGTFDLAARAELTARLAARIGPDLRDRVDRLAVEIRDPDLRLARTQELLASVYSQDLVEPPGSEPVDARAHDETWADMLRLQADGTYPAAFAAIHGPILMIHGADDPHPGAMIRDGLRRAIPQLEYREWPACGHYPWLERAAGAEVIAAIRGWLAAHVAG